MTRTGMVLLFALALSGCWPKLPDIAGHHWNGDLGGIDLYSNATGERSAGISRTLGSWQVCRFEELPHDVGPFGCKYFETETQAVNDLVKQYKELQ